jgi:hypothetical protein
MSSLHRSISCPDPGIGENCAERDREVRAAAADHERDHVCLVAGAHDQVAGLRSIPRLDADSTQVGPQAGQSAPGLGLRAFLQRIPAPVIT